MTTDRAFFSTPLEEIIREGILDVGDEVAEGQYQVIEYKGGGGSGEVYRLSSRRHGRSRVIKLFIPYIKWQQLILPTLGTSTTAVRDQSITNLMVDVWGLSGSAQLEYDYLSSVDHPFIVKVHDWGRFKVPKKGLDKLRKKIGVAFGSVDRIPGIIAAYVDGEALTEEFAARCGRTSLFAALTGLAEALDYIHFEHSLLHCDVKHENVVVRPDGYPILLDFALSLDLDPQSPGGDHEIIRGAIDSTLAPADYQASSVQETIRDLSRQGLPRGDARKRLFPHLDRYQFGRLIDRCLPTAAESLAEGERDYIAEMVKRLTDWEWLESHPNLRLSDLTARVDTNKTYPVLRVESSGGGLRLPAPTGTIKVAAPLVKFALHPALVRLNQLNQLSLLPARFPGATHSRFLHSLDTYRLTRGLARRLLDKSGFRILFDEDNVRRLLVAAMLHDVNHVPLMHVFQESGVPAYKNFPLFPFSLDREYPGVSTLRDLLNHEMGADRFLRVVKSKWENQSGPDKEVDQAISSILNAAVDVDKLSYLRLDSLFSGKEFAGGVDVEGLFEAADLVEYTDPVSGVKGPHLAFHESKLPLVEGVVGARLRGFEELYWCAENRAMMACVIDRVRTISLALVDTAGVGTPDRRLRTLIEDTASLPDYAVLVEIDKLAEDMKLPGLKLSSFFESYSDEVVSVFQDQSSFARLVGLSPSDRARVDSEIRLKVLEAAGAGSGEADLVLIDVPKRTTLDVGGRVLVRDGDTVRDAATTSPIVLRHQATFEALRQRVQVFCSTDLGARLSKNFAEPGALDRWFSEVFEDVLREAEGDWD